MVTHDSPHYQSQGFQEDFADYVGNPPSDQGVDGVQTVQPALSNVPGTPDEWERGHLHGDVQVPVRPVNDQVVKEWDENTEPRLSPAHDVVGQALASFFTRKGGWIYISQDMIAYKAVLSRPTTCKLLNDLVAVGRYESRDITTPEGKRGKVYRATGEDTGWIPTDLGIGRRITVGDFDQLKQLHQQREALRFLSAQLPPDVELPDNVVAVLNSIPEVPPQGMSDSYDRVDEYNAGNTKALLSKSVNNALADRPKRPASDDQLNLIVMHQERTGLQDDDILASWTEIDRYSPAPEGLDPSLMTSLQANRVIQWLKRQPDLPPPPAPEAVCTCDEVRERWDHAYNPIAEETWAATLGELELELPDTIFDTWLKGTKGMVFEEMDLVVKVPSVSTIAWLEQRMYQTILRALRQSSGTLLDIRFTAGPDRWTCPLHGDMTMAAESGVNDG